MPYRHNEELPSALRRHLPKLPRISIGLHSTMPSRPLPVIHAKRRHRIAWAAVKRSFVKVGDEWLARSQRK